MTILLTRRMHCRAWTFILSASRTSSQALATCPTFCAKGLSRIVSRSSCRSVSSDRYRRFFCIRLRAWGWFIISKSCSKSRFLVACCSSVPMGRSRPAMLAWMILSNRREHVRARIPCSLEIDSHACVVLRIAQLKGSCCRTLVKRLIWTSIGRGPLGVPRADWIRKGPAG